MTQEHAKYDQEVIYGTTYDTYIWKIYSKLVYVGLAQARPNYTGKATLVNGTTLVEDISLGEGHALQFLFPQFPKAFLPPPLMKGD